VELPDWEEAKWVFEVLSLPSFFAPAKKEGRQPGEIRRALTKKASTTRE
jgi:hypothetical protein